MPPAPSDDEPLTLVHQGWNHFQLQRPLAAWACWQRALRLEAEHAAAQQALEFLASAADLPAAARATYRFRTPEGDDRRARWNACFQGRDLSDLALAADAFRELASDDPSDTSAWYNHALCLAWKGANAAAITALDRVVALEAVTNPDQAADAWALADVLRQGAGAECLADDWSHALTVAWEPSDGGPTALGAVLALEPPIDPDLDRPRFQDVRAYEWLDRPMPDAAPALPLSALPRVLATVIQSPRSLRLSSPDPLSLSEAQARLVQVLGGDDRPMRRERTPLPLALLDAAAWTIRMPPTLDVENRRELSRAAAEEFHENAWIHFPRQGLDGRSPLQASQAAASGDALARVKLTGVISLREQLGARATTAELYGGYPFDRLRRRLGLPALDSGTIDANDVSCMSGPELDQLFADNLDDLRLGDAYESASGLADDARTSRFAAALVGRGAGVLALTGVDRPRLFATLVRHALATGEPEEALDWLDRALAFEEDGSSDHLRRTYDIWRAEIHARSGSPDAAVCIYEAILDRNPTDAQLALDAATTLLDGGHIEHTLSLAQRARDLARSTGDSATLARAEALLADSQ